MAKGKKKKYVPKPVNPNPLGLLAGSAPITASTLATVEVKHYSALDALTKGVGTRRDWDLVTHALNTANVLATLHKVGLEFFKDILKAQKAHNNCGVRRVKGANFGYTGPELQAVREALQVYEGQLLVASAKEVEAAKWEVTKRLAYGRFSYSPKDDKILEVESV